MSDIVKRLRSLAACDPGCYGRCKVCPDEVAREAAAEIERLRSELEAARREIYTLRQYGNKDCTAMADAAMKESK